MRRILVVITLFSGFQLWSQFQVKGYPMITSVEKRDLGVFPVVEGNDSINYILQESFLNFFDKVGIEEYLEGVDTDSTMVMDPVSFFSFEVLRNDSILTGIKVLAEGCGAYCEPFESTLNFWRNGRLIKLEDLFTSEGEETLLEKLSTFKKESIDSALKVEAQASSEDPEYFDAVTGMYSQCDPKVEELEYLDFDLLNEGMVITIGRCSNHADLALDVIGDFKFKVDYSDIRELLSPEGKKVAGNSIQFAEVKDEIVDTINLFLLGFAVIVILLIRSVLLSRKRKN